MPKTILFRIPVVNHYGVNDYFQDTVREKLKKLGYIFLPLTNEPKRSLPEHDLRITGGARWIESDKGYSWFVRFTIFDNGGHLLGASEKEHETIELFIDELLTNIPSNFLPE